MIIIIAALYLAVLMAGCSAPRPDVAQEEEVTETMNTSEYYTADTPISEVTNDPVFGEYGRLIFPVDEWYYSGNTLGQLRLTYYSGIDPDKTVEIANYLRDHAAAGDTVFYDIYTDEEKVADPDKEDTGLFFFKGNAEAKFAVCNAGGAFAYVGAMEHSETDSVLSIEDNGVGVKEYDLPYIFQKGFTGDSTDSRKKATGMGLYLTKKMADDLSLRLEASSRWGQGFKMLIRFPR